MPRGPDTPTGPGVLREALGIEQKVHFWQSRLLCTEYVRFVLLRFQDKVARVSQFLARGLGHHRTTDNTQRVLCGTKTKNLKKSKHQKQKITNISKIFQNLNISTDRTGSKKHGGATKAGGRCYLFLPAQYFLIMSDTISPIMMTGALVFPDTSVGMMDASATRSPEIPYTLKVAGKLEKSADTCWHTEVTELVFSFHENSYNNGKNLCLNTWLPKSIINKIYH